MERIEVLPLVIEDMRVRIEAGAREYGEPLTTRNGRDALQDAYEEALDLAVYLKQALLERAPQQSKEKPRECEPCLACEGTGDGAVHGCQGPCSACNGTGQIQEESECPTCQGKKSVNNKYPYSGTSTCPDCKQEESDDA